MSHKKSFRIHIFCCLLIVCINSYASEETANYIIVFKDHHQKRSILTNSEFASARTFNIIPAIAAKLNSKQLEQLIENQNVAYIEPDYPIYATGSAESSLDSLDIVGSLSSQVIPYGVEMVGATQVWSKTKGAGAIVAVLDTGISIYHPDRANIIASASFVTDEEVEDFEGHGTHTSGTVAAADNDIGVVGVAPQADLLIGKVLDNGGEGYTSWLISGIEWAVDNGADVISMSLGGTDYSASLETACDNAYAEGVLLVAAAGNDGSSTLEYPAAYDSVISVAAVDEDKEIAYFSNYGPTIELSAPGVNVFSTVPVGSDATGDAIWSDTSHQSNIIEGTAAGTVSGQIYNCGLATGEDPENTCPDSVAGNIAHIRRGEIYFSEKVAHAQSKGAIGVIISNNIPGNFLGTLATGSPLVVVSVSQADGDDLEPLAEEGTAGTVSVIADLYGYNSGTSMAAPHVSGVAALIFAAQCSISAEDVRDILINSAEDLGTPGYDEIFGYGLVDANSAFDIMQPRNCNAVWILGYGYPSDIDMDCFIEYSDLQLLAAEWLNSDCSINEWCNGADIDQNNSVSFADFAQLAFMWLACNDPEDANCTPNW